MTQVSAATTVNSAQENNYANSQHSAVTVNIPPPINNGTNGNKLSVTTDPNGTGTIALRRNLSHAHMMPMPALEK